MFGLKKFRSGLLSGLSKLPDAVFGIKLAEGQLGIFMDPKTRGSIAEIKDLKSNTFFQKDDPDIPLEDRAYRHQCIEKVSFSYPS